MANKKKCSWCSATTRKSYYDAEWQASCVTRAGQGSKWARACPEHYEEFEEWCKREWNDKFNRTIGDLQMCVKCGRGKID